MIWGIPEGIMISEGNFKKTKTKKERLQTG